VYTAYKITNGILFSVESNTNCSLSKMVFKHETKRSHSFSLLRG